MLNDWRDFAVAYRSLLRAARAIPLGGSYHPLQFPALGLNAPTALIVSPHPDDEVIMAALALRLRREGFRIVVLAMTLGRPEQRKVRRAELEAACAFLGFELHIPSEEGLIANGGTSMSETAHDVMESIVTAQDPRIIITYHAEDAHQAHKQTNAAVRVVLRDMNWDGYLFEAEYWSHMERPNMLLEVSTEDLAILLTALSFHKSELERNPYHLSLPADMTQCVRRSEIVLGRGAKAPDFDFAAMYRRIQIMHGTPSSSICNPSIIACTDRLETILR